MKKIITAIFIVSAIIGSRVSIGQTPATLIDIKDASTTLGAESIHEVEIEPTPTPTPAPEVIFAGFNISHKERKQETINMAVAIAKEFDLNSDTFLCTLNKESGIESVWVAPHPQAGELKCGDNGQSCGLGQIKIGTWKSIRKHAGWSTEDLRADDYENLRTTAYGMANGWSEHWTGYRNCRKEGYDLHN